MTNSAVLFVKSEKVEQVGWVAPENAPCMGEYRAVRADVVLSEEDKRAIQTLKEIGLAYRIVDLGRARATERLNARLEGVRITPTLFLGGQKLEGLAQIRSALEKKSEIDQR